jgi:serine protease Do
MYVRNPRFHRFILLVSLLLLITAVFTYAFLKSWYHSKPSAQQGSGPYFVEGVVKTDAEVSSLESGVTGSRDNAIVQAIRKVGASVVSISTIHVVHDPWFEFFYPFSDAERKYYGLGSGFIIDERGYVVTNHHVIADADVIKVTLSDGNYYEAKIVGSDQESDIAVLKIDGKNLTVAELGSSSDLMVGEWVIAIGNPFGYLMKDSQPTVTVGVISATGRTFQKDRVKLNSLIQTDAAINPGNSGGPLVNCYGQVIGINTAIFSTTGGYQGVGFAIPINTAKKIITKLIEHGMVKEPWLGLDFQELTKEIAEHLGLKDLHGALVSYVADGSPAQKSGLINGDVIVKIGDQNVNSPDDAIEISRLLDSGEKVSFRVFRKGEFQNILVSVKDNDVVDAAEKMLGFAVQSPTPEMTKKYGLSSYKRGALIARVRKDSSAYRAELKVGDLILRMSKEEPDSLRNFGVSEDINNLNDFIRFVSAIRKGQIIKMVIEREGELWQARLIASGD